MKFTTIKIAGSTALDSLHLHRAKYPATGEYPFLIGDVDELERIKQAAVGIEQDFDDVIASSMNVNLEEWMRSSRDEATENGFSLDDTIGEWPGELTEKGSISLHCDVLSKKVKKELLLGLARISEPWHLPAALKYGAWNDCPEAEVHCAFFRSWQAQFGAEIVGMSGDVVECIVKNPPHDQDAAYSLAWEQYWYCADIVEQGCGSVSNLAAILINSPYWFFWWD